MSKEHRTVRQAIREGDVEEYVRAFERSSDRARYALYVVIVTTVLVGMANYNVQGWSWPARRLSTWQKYAQASTPGPIPFFGGDRKRLQDASDEYLKQFVERAVFTTSPLPGVSIDVNDVGLFGGIALTLLMLVQAVCVIREHENLYLALYKVRRLCENSPSEPHKGDSHANLLYHALAMSQVISSPPTLARWKDRGYLSHLYLIFYVPAFTYGWVVVTNVSTYRLGQLYGAPILPLMILQSTMLIMLALAAITCVLNSRAMSQRWERAFFRVNPHFKHVQQPNEWRWLRIGRSSDVAKQDEREELQAHVAASLVDAVSPVGGWMETAVLIPAAYLKVGTAITPTQIAAMVRILIQAGEQEVAAWCKTHQAKRPVLREFTSTVNILVKGEWWLRGRWRFSYEPTARCSHIALGKELVISTEDGVEGPATA